MIACFAVWRRAEALQLVQLSLSVSSDTVALVCLLQEQLERDIRLFAAIRRVLVLSGDILGFVQSVDATDASLRELRSINITRARRRREALTRPRSS